MPTRGAKSFLSGDVRRGRIFRRARAECRARADTADSLVRIARAGADEDRRVRIEPVEIDVDDLVARIGEGLVVLPAEPVIHRYRRSQTPAVLRVDREVVAAEVGDRRTDLAFRVVEIPEQEIGEGGAAALRRRRQRILGVAAVEPEAAARDDAADLVVEHVAQLTAKLELVRRDGPREVVDQLNGLVVVDERRVALFAEARESRDVDVRDAPVERVVRRDVDAECLDDVVHAGAG